ncbi:hypothetical protein [Algivirga pacifica]|uniref:Uncharacterized protein n=1 Tax=Algivirga pacifica TaxID=1162670 RepID=A0ABP9DB00_9BACT
MEITVLILLIIAYIFLNIYVTKRINKAVYYKEERKKIHKTLLWAIPFLGAWMSRYFWKTNNETLEVMTKGKRTVKTGSFYESNIGMDTED